MKEFALLKFILSTEFDIILVYMYRCKKTVILKPSLFLLNVMYYPNYIFYSMYNETSGYQLARMVYQYKSYDSTLLYYFNKSEQYFLLGQVRCGVRVYRGS